MNIDKFKKYITDNISNENIRNYIIHNVINLFDNFQKESISRMKLEKENEIIKNRLKLTYKFSNYIRKKSERQRSKIIHLKNIGREINTEDKDIHKKLLTFIEKNRKSLSRGVRFSRRNFIKNLILNILNGNPLQSKEIRDKIMELYDIEYSRNYISEICTLMYINNQIDKIPMFNGDRGRPKIGWYLND
ncbi:MAG: hypothetical protein ACFFG0_07835 [Candidatus Thorarchaeota archaeon]